MRMLEESAVDRKAMQNEIRKSVIVGDERRIVLPLLLASVGKEAAKIMIAKREEPVDVATHKLGKAYSKGWGKARGHGG